MCLLCTQWELEKMSNKEAISAVGEILFTEENEENRKHFFDLINRIIDKEEELKNDENTIFLEDLDEEDSDCP